MNMLRSNLVIKGSLIFLIILTSVVIPISFFELQIIEVVENIEVKNETTGINKVENKTSISYDIIFNYELWKNSDFKTFLIGILSSSAAIVAIAFTITQIIVSNVSQKYSPKILDVYFKKANPMSSFVALILTVAGAATLLSIYNSVAPQLIVIFSTVIISGFLISLILFTVNFKMIFRVISPYYFMEDIKDLIMENITGENNE